VHQLDRDVTDGHDVARVVNHQVSAGQFGHLLHVGGLGLMDMDLDREALEQLSHALDPVAHHRTADVVGVIVRGQRSHDGHVVGAHQLDELADRVGGIDQEALAGGPVADGVDEVDHLGGHLVVAGEVPSREELPEVQPVIHDPRAYEQPPGLDRPAWSPRSDVTRPFCDTRTRA
jgi:hypothetical protein